LLRGLLTPLAWLHQIGLEVYLLPYRTGLRRRFRLRDVTTGRPIPTIAIGNLTSGGTGKTPMAALVARRLGEPDENGRPRRVVVLSRGYRAQGEADGGPRIVSDGTDVLLDPGAAGDEPVLLARLLPGVPVVIGKDRRQSGRLAAQRFRPDVIVLDDALQFWQLERDLDIVLLDARRPFDNGYVLPRGLLREPPWHLRRAGVVVLTRADRIPPEALAATRARVARLAPRAEVFSATHTPTAWIRRRDEQALPLDSLHGRDVFCFAGIADFDSFAQTVEALGARTVGLRRFADHHAYSDADIAALAREAAGRDDVVTTEKDAVKVAPRWPHAPLGHGNAPPAELHALRIALRLDDEPTFAARLRQAVYGAAASGRGR
jgi:tetraacyldisaccharide 4'-kinase